MHILNKLIQPTKFYETRTQPFPPFSFQHTRITKSIPKLTWCCSCLMFACLFFHPLQEGNQKRQWRELEDLHHSETPKDTKKGTYFLGFSANIRRPKCFLCAYSRLEWFSEFIKKKKGYRTVEEFSILYYSVFFSCRFPYHNPSFWPISVYLLRPDFF